MNHHAGQPLHAPHRRGSQRAAVLNNELVQLRPIKEDQSSGYSRYNLMISGTIQGTSCNAGAAILENHHADSHFPIGNLLGTAFYTRRSYDDVDTPLAFHLRWSHVTKARGTCLPTALEEQAVSTVRYAWTESHRRIVHAPSSPRLRSSDCICLFSHLLVSKPIVAKLPRLVSSSPLRNSSSGRPLLRLNN